MNLSEARPAFISSIDCIRLYVSDLAAGLAFYRDQLGCQLVWKTQDEAGLRVRDGSAEIVLHMEKAAPEIDFKVDSADDAARQFEGAGGKVLVPPFDIRIGRAAVVKDPWGNSYILLDASKGLLATDEYGNITGNLEPESSPSSSI